MTGEKIRFGNKVLSVKLADESDCIYESIIGGECGGVARPVEFTERHNNVDVVTGGVQIEYKCTECGRKHYKDIRGEDLNDLVVRDLNEGE